MSSSSTRRAAGSSTPPPCVLSAPCSMALGSRTAPWASPLTFFLPSSPRLQLSHCSLTPAAGSPAPPSHLLDANVAGRTEPSMASPSLAASKADSQPPLPCSCRGELPSSKRSAAVTSPGLSSNSRSSSPTPASMDARLPLPWRPCFSLSGQENALPCFPLPSTPKHPAVSCALFFSMDSSRSNAAQAPAPPLFPTKQQPQRAAVVHGEQPLPSSRDITLVLAAQPIHDAVKTHARRCRGATRDACFGEAPKPWTHVQPESEFDRSIDL
ncbi:protein PRRC2C-like [Zea mays]|uniref:protein PRRC2C-like n=1 Tax=Zea mays TaxID=4577 RepID=UPI001652DFD1|nr:protein PRRC2C-like [Zea mays]